MIVVCPNCETRYVVDDAAVGAEAGRRVRCASCGNVWRYTAEAAAIQAVVAEVTAEAEAAAAANVPVASAAGPAGGAGTGIPAGPAPGRAEPRFDVPPHPVGPIAQPHRAGDVERDAAAARSRGTAWLIAVAAVVLAIVAAIVARDRVMQMWPITKRVYAELKLAEPAGAGLEVTVTPTRTPDTLVIDGDIVNRNAKATEVPRLRVTLRDGNKVSIASRVIPPPVDQLGPGASAHFSTVFENPSITATGVDVTFAD